MRTMELRKIGILLMQIDYEQMLLTRLLTQERLRSATVYQEEIQRIEKLRKHVLQELAELVRQRYWRGSNIKGRT
ncbi:MAG: hypothetical protein AAF320_02260 [Myxococcota bacterium]